MKHGEPIEGTNNSTKGDTSAGDIGAASQAVFAGGVAGGLTPLPRPPAVPFRGLRLFRGLDDASRTLDR